MPAHSQDRFGGPAPLPECRFPGGFSCSADESGQGAASRLQSFCENFASSHRTDGGDPCALKQYGLGSRLTQCRLADPPIGPGSEGGTWASARVIMGGTDLQPHNWGGGDVYLTWGPSEYQGATCACPGGSLTQPDATCACPAGQNWDDTRQRCAVRPPDPLRISLSGGDHTRALPAGPALPLTAMVTRGGGPAGGVMVTVQMGAGASLSGYTDAAGRYSLAYVPPLLLPTSTELVATCAGCVNEAHQSITVDACHICGDAFGNPVQPATGTKLQDEIDWRDAGAHPLTLARHWRSTGNVPTGLGSHWSHDYAGQLRAQGNSARVALGDGTLAWFVGNAGGWQAEQAGHRLEQTAQGWTFTRPDDDSRYTFDATGRLLAITQRNGWTHQLSYDETAALVQVRNAFGRTLRWTHDAAGRLQSVTTPDGQVITYGYDAAGRLTQVRGTDGLGRSYLYEDVRWSDKLTGIVDEQGQRLSTYRYDAHGLALSTEGAGGVNAYAIDYGVADVPAATGSLVALQALSPALYQLQARVTDPIGNTQRLTWQGGDGRVRRVAASGLLEGDTLAQVELDRAGLPAAETDFTGVRTDYSWDPSRQLPLAITRAANRPEAQAVQVQWHAAFALPLQVTQAGRRTDYAYDDAGRLLSQTVTDTASSRARTWAWSYNAQSLPDTLTLPGAGAWRFDYDALGNRTRSTDPTGAVTTFTFDARGRILTQTDPAGLVTTWTYDARGRRLSQARGDEVTRYGYTATGLLASVQQSDGYAVQYQYDAAQRLVGASDNRGASVVYTLDSAGHRLREEVRDATGAIAQVTQRTLNALGQVISQQDASGQTTAFAYDANGAPILRTDPLGQATGQVLDGLGRITAVAFADGASATQAWNPLNQLQQLVDPKGVATTYTTNAFGEVLVETSPDAGSIVYDRDADGNVVQMRDAKGQVTHIQRDAMRRPVRITHADGSEIHSGYDAAGRLVHVEDASGATELARDAQGRPLRKTQQVNDQPANPSRFEFAWTWEQGHVSSLTYPSGLQVFYRRQAGRIVGIDVRRAGRRQTAQPWITALAYTALGQPSAWRWASGDAAARVFDSNGRLTQTEFARYGYDAAGRLTRITQDLWARAVQEGREELFVTPLSWQVSYDRRDRLTSFSREGAQTRYTYDANSNRLTSQDTLTSDTDLDGQYENDDYRIDTERALAIEAASNRLLGFTQTLTQTFPPARNGHPRPPRSVTTPVTYTLDANGSMTSDGLRRFDYDAAGRLSRVRVLQDGDEVGISYLHNALGQRVFKGEPQATRTRPDEAQLGVGFITWLRRSFGWLFNPTQGSTHIGTAFVYGDGEGTLPPWVLLGEYDNGSASGRGRTEYLWLPTEDGGAIPVGLYRGNRLYAIHSDHLGTPRLVTNDLNEPVWQWPYSAFGDNKPSGVLRSTANPKAALTNQPQLLRATAPMEMNLRMPGQYYDAEVGTFYNLMRDFDPLHGRYRQADPIGMAGGWNGYGYVEGNPLSYIDPMGLDRWGAEHGVGIVYTQMDLGRTIYYDSFSGDYFELASRNKVGSNSKPGAAGPYSGLVTYCERGRLARAFGTAKMRTTDPRSRWIHGGGSGLPDPYEPQQGWKPTEGCTRAQNEDVENLCSEVDVFRSRYPVGTLLYRRD